MKILQIKDSHAYYAVPQHNPKRISEINDEDVLELVRLIIRGEEADMDGMPDEDACPNQAERIIYEELYKQFTQLIENRQTLIDDINEQFTEARNLYETVEPAKSFEEWIGAETS